MKNQLSNSSRLYEYRLVILIFFAWGFLFLDRSALSYIIPAMVGDLELTTGQVGQINMWQTIGFAISGPIIGMISDKTGKRKPLLIAAILATAVFSALSGLANSYHSLLIIRFLVGVCEGPIYPLAMLMIASASSPGRFGRNAGIVNAGVAVIAVALGPILVTQTISMLNWHWAFVIISIPSLILGLLVYLFTNEISPDKIHQTEQKQKTSFTDIFKYRNMFSACLLQFLVWEVFGFSIHMYHYF
ncbi:MFS transporter [Metabacillus litoralis]|uniref:MFS transporter n=1 Tax=Metabacillus litoralis TaxID=152268 RepID=UPI000EF5E2C1|nr:MFS transporter [Metabacillus litoralis]